MCSGASIPVDCAVFTLPHLLGIGFCVFIVTASLSRFSAQVVSKSNARKLLRSMKKELEKSRKHHGRKTLTQRIQLAFNKVRRQHLLVKFRRAIRKLFLLFTIAVQVVVLAVLYYGNVSPESCGQCNGTSCEDSRCATIDVFVNVSSTCHVFNTLCVTHNLDLKFNCAGI